MEMPSEIEPTFVVAHQTVDLDVDFQTRSITGKTELLIHPQSKDLKTITLNVRQIRITRFTVNGKPVTRIRYNDPCRESKLCGQQTVHQHHLLSKKIEKLIKPSPAGELTFDVPRSVRIEESVDGAQDDLIARFTPLTILIEFVVDSLGEGLQFVAYGAGPNRYPHAYTPRANVPGVTCAIFPCVDSVDARCSWDINITCPRTVGDALRERRDGSHEDREMIVVCSGDDAGHRSKDAKSTFSFSCARLSAQQIGFAVGPFEEIKLSDFRLAEDDVGQNAVEVLGFCLPGREEEVRNTCLPTVKAMDFVTLKYVACPFKTYRMCFVDDLESETEISGGLTFCSSKLLFPVNITHTAEEVTRKLVHGIVSQWVGIDLVPQQPTDTWAIVGIAHYVTEAFMRELCGNNEYRSRMKSQADRIVELDHNRPSLFNLGAILHVDPSGLEFMALKAPLVLFILERRIAKIVGLPKMPAIISKILTRARNGDISALSTELFQRTCEKFYHSKIDDFMTQWVKGGGCPRFRVGQRFNKKKLVVEMVITQVQAEAVRDLSPDTFLRDVREEYHDIYAATPQPVFSGPITIRVHEADGTPYEHVVQIREARQTIEIPYSTKYKRLKRKRQKEDDESLLYSLGDVLQTEAEIKEWQIAEWDQESELRMSSESYEWIRVDADFEWICRIDMSMPGYMWSSQLQQDRDVAAQMESLLSFNRFDPMPLISSIYLRTAMDRRYFHRVRSMAVHALVRQSTEKHNHIGFFHLKKIEADDRSSDIQSAVIEAISEVKDNGAALPEAVDLLLDRLKFPKNDCFYIATLMQSLCRAVCTRKDLEVEDYLRQRQGIELIDRYKKMDEWSPSYQNIYSRTALECQLLLAQAGIFQAGSLHFLPFTRPGNLDLLRKVAFESLMPKVLSNSAVLRYTMICMAGDPSPWIRAALRVSFGKLLGAIAIGIDSAAPVDGLEIVGDTQSGRKQNVDLALAALKVDILKDNSEVLKEALWKAVSSGSLTEKQELLVFCRMLYDPKDSVMVRLQYPRYWGITQVNNGVITFRRTAGVRTKAVKKWEPKKYDLLPPKDPVPKIVFKTPAPEPKPLKLKLSMPKWA